MSTNTYLEKLQAMEAMELMKEKMNRVRVMAKIQSDIAALDLSRGSERSKIEKLVKLVLEERENVLLIEKVIKEKDY